MRQPNREVKVTWYDDPAEAERDLEAEYAALSPDDRVAECLRLKVLFAGWEEHGRLARVTRLIDVP